jgi:hypothetical protein
MQRVTSFFLKFESSLLVKRPFYLLNAAFSIAILDLISHLHLASLLSGYPDIWNIPHSPAAFLSIIICGGDAFLESLFTLVSYTFISFPQHLQISVSLMTMPSSTAASLANSTSGTNGVSGTCHLHNPSGRTMALGSIRPLT